MARSARCLSAASLVPGPLHHGTAVRANEMRTTPTAAHEQRTNLSIRYLHRLIQPRGRCFARHVSNVAPAGQVATPQVPLPVRPDNCQARLQMLLLRSDALPELRFAEQAGFAGDWLASSSADSSEPQRQKFYNAELCWPHIAHQQAGTSARTYANMFVCAWGLCCQRAMHWLPSLHGRSVTHVTDAGVLVCPQV
jgi:hypothetical protein